MKKKAKLSLITEPTVRRTCAAKSGIGERTGNKGQGNSAYLSYLRSA